MVKFWPTTSGNFLSHNKGVTLDQLSFFKSIKLGDMLIIYVNDDGSITLKKSTFKKEEQE